MSTELRVGVDPGDGVVVRAGDVVAFVPAAGANDVAAVEAVIAAVRAAAGGAGAGGAGRGGAVDAAAGGAADPATGTAAAAAVVADALAALDAGAPPVVVVFGGAGSPHVVLCGDIEARVTAPGSTVHLDGRIAAEPVLRDLHGPVDTVVVGTVAAAAPRPWADLGAGVVPGGGVTIRWAPAPAAASSTDPTHVGTESAAPPIPSTPAAAPGTDQADESADDPSDALADNAAADSGAGPPTDPANPPALDVDAAFESVSFVGLDLAPGKPLPIDAPTGDARTDVAGASVADTDTEDTDVAGGVRVRGLHCRRGHFNHPHAANCAWCGLAMLQDSYVLVEGDRPPLGVLVVNEQTTFTLDHDYVLGRSPATDPAVEAGTSRPLLLEDPDRSVSRIHAAVELRDWDVVLVDRGSANGTWVLGPGAAGWERLVPDTPRILRPGDHLQIGPHRLAYHSHHVR